MRPSRRFTAFRRWRWRRWLVVGYGGWLAEVKELVFGGFGFAQGDGAVPQLGDGAAVAESLLSGPGHSYNSPLRALPRMEGRRASSSAAFSDFRRFSPSASTLTVFSFS